MPAIASGEGWGLIGFSPQQLADAFRGADDILINQLDPLVAKLAAKQPAFYAKYKAARVIIDPPGGHGTSGDSGGGGGGTPVPPAT